MSTADLSVYLRRAKLACSWANANYPFSQRHLEKTLYPYLERVPAGADRGFWLGEILSDIRLDAATQLSNRELAEYDRTVAELMRLGDKAGLVANPAGDPEDLEHAKEKFETFHRYAVRDVGEFARGFAIPSSMLCAGRAKWTTYRSGKVDPSTLKLPKRPVNYIHEHDAGVEVYLPTDCDLGESGLETVDVPEEFQRATALAKLGDSLGYCFDLDGDEVEAVGQDPLPELYCTPCGKCLLVVQDKREVLAMIWGGALGVFARGIDG